MSTAAPERRAPTAPARPALIVSGVTRVRGARRVLDHVSLSVERSAVHALVGPNGSGKTTLLRILAGVLVPDGGRVDRDPGVAAGIGYVPQRFFMYDELTVGENLRFHARMRGLGDAAAAAALSDFGLRAQSERRSGALSGGERQRLLIAAALLHRPALLLLDEPTTALDAESRATLWSLLRAESAAGTTIVITTHESTDARECSASTWLRDGRVVGSDRLDPSAVRS